MYAALIDWLFGVPGSWSIRSCSICDLVWLHPQPATEEIPALYARYYTHGSLPRTWLAILREAIARRVFARMGYAVPPTVGILPRLLSYIPSVARAASLDVMDLAPSANGELLDVGCGNGDFILRMRALGWNVSGVDPDPAAVTRGQSMGLPIYAGTIADVPNHLHYDVITLNHVMEHVSDPVEVLRECGKRLRPQTGKIVITTPNARSLGHRWFRRHWRGLEVPRHFIIFSPRALADCVTRSGLEVSRIRTETRLSRMIYQRSVCAREGFRNVGEKTDFKLTTKIAAYAFQFLEDALIPFQKDIGEEVYCMCIPVGEDNDDRK